MDKNILYVDILNNVKFLKWNYDRRDTIMLTVENRRQSREPFYPMTLHHNSTSKTTRQTHVHSNTYKSNMQNIWAVYPHAFTPQVLVS